jgi:predicted phage-related endonuclease
VEHLVGASQGGYINDIRQAISKRFPTLSNEQREELALRIDKANTVTACHFCNSTTSRYQNIVNLTQLISEAEGDADEVVNEVESKLKEILRYKQDDVRKKLESIREAFSSMIKPELDKHADRNPTLK